MAMQRPLAVSAAVIVVVAAIASVAIMSLTPADTGANDVTISWHRSGGIAGVSDDVTVFPNGSAVCSSSRLGTTSVLLNNSALAEILSLVKTINSSITYVAKGGAADYFGYRLTLNYSQTSKVVEWVDGWASSEQLPIELAAIQSFMTSIAQSAQG